MIRMNSKIIFASVVIAATVVVFLLAPNPPKRPWEMAATSGPELTLAKGETLFLQYCMVCHGKDAKGAVMGPPLVHRYYAPNRHSDAAFYLAVEQGVRQYLWKFGDMKPMQGFRREEVTFMLRYVRDLQKKAGIF